MKASPTRVAAVTGGLLFAGALFGSVAATVGAAIAMTITEGGVPSVPVMELVAVIGGVLGAPLLPATAWLLLRRVPLGLSFLGTTVGAVLGGVAGWIAAVGANGDLFTWPIAGAVLGFFAAVVLLRIRFSTGRDAARPASRGALQAAPSTTSTCPGR